MHKTKRKNISSLIELVESKDFWNYLLLTGLLISTLAVIDLLVPHEHSAHHSSRIFPDSLLETKFKGIASKFLCTCGKCKRDNLLLCNCKFAQEQKRLIRSMLVEKNDEQVIIAKINSLYGGLQYNEHFQKKE